LSGSRLLACAVAAFCFLFVYSEAPVLRSAEANWQVAVGLLLILAGGIASLVLALVPDAPEPKEEP
jgi:hypothetical protein